MTTPLSAVQIEHLKRDAKRLARKLSIRLCEAQSRLAVAHGYASWPLLAHASKVAEEALRARPSAPIGRSVIVPLFLDGINLGKTSLYHRLVGSAEAIATTAAAAALPFDPPLQKSLPSANAGRSTVTPTSRSGQ